MFGMNDSIAAASPRPHPGTVAEVFWVFLRLGVTSFGGPVAHLGYFREAFVARRQWLGDRAYADLVALCQFLPGPASSKVGMAIGLQRAGFAGLLAAWVGFTLPSAVLLVAFAYGLTSLGDVSGAGWIQGLMAAAVAVVAQAVMGMARTLTPDAKRATIAAAGMIVVLLIPSPLTQVAVILAAALAGLFWLRAGTPAGSDEAPFTVRVPRWVGLACFAVFGALLALLPRAARDEADVVGNRHVREQGKVLEQVADAALLRRQVDALLTVKEDFAVEHDAPAVRPLEARDALECHALATAGSAEQSKDLIAQREIRPQGEITQLFLNLDL